MREPERDLGRLHDILQAAENIIAFTAGYSQAELAADKLRYFAVRREDKSSTPKAGGRRELFFYFVQTWIFFCTLDEVDIA